MKTKYLTDWEKATDNLAKYFTARYFGKDAEAYWIADDIGGCYQIADYFFNTEHMVDYIRYGYSKDLMFKHCDYALRCAEKNKHPINIKTYKKLKK